MEGGIVLGGENVKCRHFTPCILPLNFTDAP
jgi:hypothetical protein